ncbi:MAG: hypothetical protein ACLQJR_09945 [Stellaceae bacterium]
MPFVPLKIRPDVNTQFTGTLLETGRVVAAASEHKSACSGPAHRR